MRNQPTTKAKQKMKQSLQPPDVEQDDDTPMDLGVEEIGQRWIEEEGRLNTCELELRYRWAQDVKYLHERSEQFGPDAARHLSQVFSRDDHDINDYYRIVTYVGQDFVDTVLAFNRQRMGQRGYITWHHLRCFASVMGLATQRELLDICMTDRLSVTELREEITNWDERLQEIASKQIRTPSLKTLMTRLILSTSKLCDDVSALDSHDARRPIDKLRTGTKKAVAELDSASQSIATCIERLQNALGSLDRAKAIVITKPKGRQSSDTEA